MHRAAALFARPPLTALLVALAAAVGIAIVRLPLEHAAALVLGGVMVAASVWIPALGIGLALALGPARAFLAVARPDLPADLGQLFFALGVAGWLGRGLATRSLRLPRIPLLVPLGLYISVGLFSLLEAQALEEGLKESLKWFEIGLGLVILVDEAKRGRAAWLVVAILSGGLVQALIGLWQFEFRGAGPEHFRLAGGQFRAYGTFEQPNPYGGYLGLIWPVAAGLALGQWRRARAPLGSWTARASARLLFGAYAALTALMLAALYVSFSRGAWLGAGAAAVAMTLVLPRRVGVGLSVALAAALAAWGLSQSGLLPAGVAARLADVTDFVRVADVRGANINDANFALLERRAHWQAAEAMARHNPWLGVGLGNYAAAYSAHRLFNWENALGHAHMIYLNVLAETGLFGLVTYVTLWAAVFALTMRVIRRADGARRGLAIGLLGAWAHLAAHQIVDNLFVNNIHFLIAGLLALLVHHARPLNADDRLSD